MTAGFQRIHKRDAVFAGMQSQLEQSALFGVRLVVFEEASGGVLGDEAEGRMRHPTRIASTISAATIRMMFTD